MKAASSTPVAGIVGRDRHDRAGAVGGKDVVGDEDGDLLAVDGVDALDAAEADAGLVLVQLRALEIGLGGGLRLIGADLVRVRQLVHPLPDQGVLRREDHVGRAEQGIRAGGVDRDLVAEGGGKLHLRAVGTAHPVDLLGLDALGVVDLRQIVDQAVCVGRDAEHPLAALLADDGRAAALADALHDLLVCQDALAGGTPVDGHLGLVGQTLFEHLQEDPLGPLVVGRIGGVHLAVPVEAVAEGLELGAEDAHVPLGDGAGMDVVLDGVVLGGQAEGVVADREQDVIALHALLAGDHVQRRRGAGVTDVQTDAGRERELDQGVELGLVGADLRLVDLLIQPVFLPFGLDLGKVVFHASASSATGLASFQRRSRS